MSIHSELYSVEGARLRVGLKEKLRTWDAYLADAHTTDIYNFMAELLGYVDFDQMANNYTSEDHEKFRMLNGPHGHCYYKMLLARRGG